MNALLKIAGAVMLAAGLSAPVVAYADSTVTAPGGTTSGTYMDYMKTVYNRAGAPELIMLPLTEFDNEYQLQPMAAKSWSQSADGLTWTFVLQDGLVWSDGTPLTAGDYVFALQRAAKGGYDFNWYWSFAGGIKGWSDVTDKGADPSTLGIKAIDDKTLEVTTDAPKSYFPGVASLWYAVPKHVVDKLGDDYALNVDTLVSSGPFMVKTWEKSNNTMTLVKSPTYNGPWPAQIDTLVMDTQIGPPEVGFPAFMAGEADYTALNTGQVPVVSAQFPDAIRKDAVFAVYYLAFDTEMAPFDNVDVRKAFWYAINRDELTSTVLKDVAVAARSVLSPSYPGYQQKIADQAVFDPQKAKDALAKAGYADGKGFPPIEIWYREQGGYNAAIAAPTLQYLQAQFKQILGIDMAIKSMPTPDWTAALKGRTNNLFLAPYEYDYLDPSNFYDLFKSGGRHHYSFPDYDELVNAGDAGSDWNARLDNYAKAEQVLIDNAALVPLVHPVTIAAVSDKLQGPGVTPNSKGFTPLDRLSGYLYTHITKQ
ncbi:MAG: peptide ABC transporter substrate-binding protein [Devosia nanyangense]|uniref:Peptide ABC transporter substrate-binding protein n=1 Tax=Devosia nanyangense TaxID=1228055 RepID=A0A933NXR4_9HYPH|nr:peptide ABC transporter substrate-binding protein [Devosia nanyangense]